MNRRGALRPPPPERSDLYQQTRANLGVILRSFLVTLGVIWVPFRVTLEVFFVTLGVIFGSLWGHHRIILGS